ncbi:MAG: TrbC/VirB2 family protein [Thermomicrobiales bacterium]|jgi:hypothetical protein
MAAFFYALYNNLVAPLAIALGVVAFAAAAVQFLLGHREGVERLLRVAVGLFLLGFAPVIVQMIWSAVLNSGGGVASGR